MPSLAPYRRHPRYPSLQKDWFMRLVGENLIVQATRSRRYSYFLACRYFFQVQTKPSLACAGGGGQGGVKYTSSDARSSTWGIALACCCNRASIALLVLGSDARVSVGMTYRPHCSSVVRSGSGCRHRHMWGTSAVDLRPAPILC